MSLSRANLLAFVITASLVPFSTTRAEEPRRLAAKDTLAPTKDDSPDAQACLNELVWQPASFEVTCKEIPRPPGRKLVRFPSPISTGNEQNDSVALDWYVACDEAGDPVMAPAVIVVHESGSQMTVGRTFAYSLQLRGVHAFMIHLPHYGERRTELSKTERASHLVAIVRQAVADVRRARDAIAVLPHVDARHISVQGTSLGGFVTSTAASLDDSFSQVFIVLAGGDLHDVLSNGQKDAAQLRHQLEDGGYTGENLKDLLWQIEPTRLTHRLDPEKTWLFSATRDQVVPLKNAKLLARSAKLDEQHHVLFLANHYTGILYLPTVVEHIIQQIKP
jgi:dienelactone hydrolase